MPRTTTFRRLTVAATAGTLLTGLGLACSPASAQQRDYSNPLATPASDDLDISRLVLDANATSVTMRLRAEHLPDAFITQTILSARKTVTEDARFVSVIAEYSGGAWRLTAFSQGEDGKDQSELPEEALHASLSGGDIQVTIDQPAVGWAGPYYAVGGVFADGHMSLAAAATKTVPSGEGFESIDGFGPVSSAPDATSTRVILPRTDGRSPGRVTATVTPALPGTVTFYDGTRALGTSTVSNGTASIAMPTPLSPGTHSLRAAFTPSDTLRYAPSEATARVQALVAKLKLSARVQHRGRKPAKATVTVAGARSGSAVLYDGARRLRTARFTNGRLALALPKNLRTGRHTIKAVVTSAEAGSTATTTTNVARLKVAAR